jgi:uncharacterized membrane protein YidH (DUF202 family)
MHVSRATDHIIAGRPILAWSLGVAGLLSLAMIAAGVWLVVLGASGETEISLFGNTFKSQNVGVVGIFCGAVLAVLTIRRVLKSVERLGGLPPQQVISNTIPIGATAKDHPDWTIRDLFFHIRPDLIDDPKAKAWQEVGRDVMDKFSTGRLKVWGRPIMPVTNRRAPLKRVDEAEYWIYAEFTFWFLDEGNRESAHTSITRAHELPEYADLQVNRAEALEIWPDK